MPRARSVLSPLKKACQSPSIAWWLKSWAAICQGLSPDGEALYFVTFRCCLRCLWKTADMVRRRTRGGRLAFHSNCIDQCFHTAPA